MERDNKLVKIGTPQFAARRGTAEVERKVRCLLGDAMKRSKKSRIEVAADMAEMLGRPVTVSMLRDFTRSATMKRSVRFPAAWIPAFCKATGSDELQRFLLSPELVAALELGEWDIKHLKRGKPPAKAEVSKTGAPRRWSRRR